MKKNEPVLQIVSMPAGHGKKTNGLHKTNPVQTFGIFTKATLPPFVAEGSVLTESRQKVFLDRYSMKDEKGIPMEQHPEEMWWRVANGIAAMEKTDELRKHWAKEFYHAMEDFKFVPGGRILSGGGTGFEVTFFNCYVIPSPKDSRGGIMENITHTVEIQARGGGVGINLSSLRPNGARVKKVNGTSSGPVSWAALYSAANHDVIQQGGSRRGALMLMLHDWHPDVIEFIHVKEDLTKIPGANLSVCVSDKFMEAVKNDDAWTTKFPDITEPDYDEVWDGDIEKWESMGKKVKVYGVYKARDIWDQICVAAWTSAEPGLHFLERSNKWSPTWYFEKLLSTNPCVTGDTLVATEDGWKRVDEIKIGDTIGTVLSSGRVDQIEVHDKREVFKVKFSDGAEVRTTAAHQFHAIIHEDRAKNSANKKFSPIRLDQLKVGDMVRVSPALMPDKPVADLPDGWSEKEYGFFVGVLLGDGCITETSIRRNVVKVAINTEEKEWVEIIRNVLKKAGSKFVTLDAGLGLSANLTVQNSGGAAMLVRQSYIKPAYSYEKRIPIEYQSTNREFLSGLLDGLFSTDGNVNLTSTHPFIRLKTTSKQLALDIRRILLCFGIHGRVVTIKKVAEGHIGDRIIHSKHTQYKVVISGAGFKTFAEQINLTHPQKRERLQEARLKFSLTGNTWLSQIISIEPDGIEKVYDLHEPISDTWITEGIVSRGCGEQPLGEWAVCNLGAMNLAAFVDKEEFNYEKLTDTVKVAMRFMDNVVDANYYFYDENEKRAKDIRRTGIGTMGLGDALIKMKIKYGSDESLEVMEKIYATIRDVSYETSSDLAKEKGAFPKFDAKKYAQGHFIQSLPQSVQDKIAKQGIRNAVILTQAPTGTTSILSGVSSGIEPVYDFAFIRKDRIGTHTIYHPLYQAWKEQHPDEEKPDYFVSANDLTPQEHVTVQALAQKYTDSSISKTVNAPNSHTVEDVKELYMMAYDLGCKGVTYFRDGSRTGVLSHMETEEEKKEEPAQAFVSRPMILNGRTYRMQTPLGEAFVTINRDQQNQPFEVFVTIGKGGMHTMADAEAIGRLVSLSLRLARVNGQLNAKEVARKIIAQLRGIGGASHVGFGKDRVMSLADAIAKVLAEDLAVGEELEVIEQVPLNLTQEVNTGSDDVVLSTASKSQADLCPECGSVSFVMEEGCKKCYSCGYSMC